jgi:hypothetical protein
MLAAKWLFQKFSHGRVFPTQNLSRIVEYRITASENLVRVIDHRVRPAAQLTKLSEYYHNLIIFSGAMQEIVECVGKRFDYSVVWTEAAPAGKALSEFLQRETSSGAPGETKWVSAALHCALTD